MPQPNTVIQRLKRHTIASSFFLICLTILAITQLTLLPTASAQESVFGAEFSDLEKLTTGQWWDAEAPKKKRKKFSMNLNVERDQVVAFAIYTHDHGTLKLTAQLFPLMPDEAKETRLEFKQSDGSWKEVAKQEVIELGWSSHFRIDNWNNTKDVAYRVRHGEAAQFEGLIRKDPIDKETIVVGNLSCNSARTPGPRPLMVENLIKLDPDFLFFAGDQTYHHTEHTYGWLEFGMQFREVMKDRPVVTIPDDHDVGQANIWGENGKKATTPQGPSGGYFYPTKYVNMVQRCQTWHLPDPYDATPIEQGISVYYTDLTIGGINFAILEDRKFKSGPEGKIPIMGPRPDHINDPKYDREAGRPARIKIARRPSTEVLEQLGSGLDRRRHEMRIVANRVFAEPSICMVPKTIDCSRTWTATLGRKKDATKRSPKSAARGLHIFVATNTWLCL